MIYMNKRVAFLLTGLMIFTNVNTLLADVNTNDISVKIAATAMTTTSGAITTTDSALKYGITDKVITTNKGTIQILDDGSIITTGNTDYNPKTATFDTPTAHFTTFEKIYIGGRLGKTYGDDGYIRYKNGSVINKNYTFIYGDRVYTLSKGDMYTRWDAKGDDVAEMNIMPLLSFMVMEGKWFLFETSTRLYPRYTGEDSIDEIIVINQLSVKLEEDTLIQSADGSEQRILQAGCMLIATEGRSNYITDRGIIPDNTIVNNLDGSVELVKDTMYITDKNVKASVQNMRMDNIDIAFKPFIINFSDDVPPVDSGDDVVEPPVNNETPSYSNGGGTVISDTTQKLSKDKQYEHTITSPLSLTYKNDIIKLEKGDRIILPRGLEKINKVLPCNTLIIKSDGKRLILKNEYTVDGKLTFTESKERYLAFVFYINNKPYEFVIRLK